MLVHQRVYAHIYSVGDWGPFNAFRTDTPIHRLPRAHYIYRERESLFLSSLHKSLIIYHHVFQHCPLAKWTSGIGTSEAIALPAGWFRSTG